MYSIDTLFTVYSKQQALILPIYLIEINHRTLKLQQYFVLSIGFYGLVYSGVKVGWHGRAPGHDAIGCKRGWRRQRTAGDAARMRMHGHVALLRPALTPTV